jgi:serine/threonine protein kinase
MAPEQVAADPRIDHRADLYALGLVAYEMLAGGPAYSATTPQQQMAAHLTQAPTPIHLKRPDCPPALAALVTRCLSKNPDDRWQTAEDVVNLLGAIETMTPHRASRWTHRRIGVLVGAAVLLVAVTLGVRRLAGPPRETASPNVLAVLPFTVRGSPTLEYLSGEGEVTVPVSLRSELTQCPQIGEAPPQRP